MQKKALNIDQRDSGVAIKNTEEMITVLENVKNHNAEVALALEQEERQTFPPSKESGQCASSRSTTTQHMASNCRQTQSTPSRGP